MVTNLQQVAMPQLNVEDHVLMTTNSSTYFNMSFDMNYKHKRKTYYSLLYSFNIFVDHETSYKTHYLPTKALDNHSGSVRDMALETVGLAFIVKNRTI